MITLYDTACGSRNLGDQIIMDAVVNELGSILPNEMMMNYPTHYPMSKEAKRLAWSNELSFVGGTNLLKGHWRTKAKDNQWACSLLDSWAMSPAILMGVGWHSYSDKITTKAKAFYRNALSSEYMHACRDNYSTNKLKSVGFENVINTGCPTTWALSAERLAKLSKTKSESVVFTLTDYRQDESSDTDLINQLVSAYNKVYFWPQGHKDRDYFMSLLPAIKGMKEKIQILPMNLNAFNAILKTRNIDYIGTRLHAGVRALQLDKRALIISVDNRAKEMGSDFGLPVIPRVNSGDIVELLLKTDPANLQLPDKEISLWKEQFQSLN